MFFFVKSERDPPLSFTWKQSQSNCLSCSNVSTAIFIFNSSLTDVPHSAAYLWRFWLNYSCPSYKGHTFWSPASLKVLTGSIAPRRAPGSGQALKDSLFGWYLHPSTPSHQFQYALTIPAETLTLCPPADGLRPQVPLLHPGEWQPPQSLHLPKPVTFTPQHRKDASQIKGHCMKNSKTHSIGL